MSKQESTLKPWQFLLTAILTFSSLAFSESISQKLRPVDPLPLPTQGLADQFDQAFVMPTGDFQILFSSDMESYQLLRDNLPSDYDAEMLKKKKLILVADISAMPSLIAKMFALPKMRKLKYPIHLDRDGEVTKGWPRDKAQLTVLNVENGKIASAKILTNATDLTAFLTQ